MWKSLAKELQKELLYAHRRVHACRLSVNLEKRKVRLNYEKVQLIKSGKPYEHITKELQELEVKGIEIPSLDAKEVKHLIKKSDDMNNLKNVVNYLKSRRVYDELLERYNPGLTMSQQQNIQKSANMVGLKVPE